MNQTTVGGKLVAIVGPTASGKSAFAMKVAEAFDGEIICADSRTIYRYMDIGTAKPTKVDQAIVPHHLLDVVEPNQPFNVADFKRLAEAAITNIQARGKLPIVVGGTGLYVDALLFDYKFGPKADSGKRALLMQMEVEQLASLCLKLGIVLPENYLNKRHLIRAIELGGLRNDKKSLRANTIVVGITLDKATLRKRIELRAGQMIDEGVLSEVRLLGERYGWDSEAMTGNIYRTFKKVVINRQALQTVKQDFIKSDLKLAKRQLTWFKRNQFIIWEADTNVLFVRIGEFMRS